MLQEITAELLDKCIRRKGASTGNLLNISPELEATVFELWARTKAYLRTTAAEEVGVHQQDQAGKLDDLASLFLMANVQLGFLHSHVQTAFNQLVKIGNNLDKFDEHGVFSHDQLDPIVSKMASIDSSRPNWRILVKEDSNLKLMAESLVKFVQKKFEACNSSLNELQSKLNSISEALWPIHNRLVELKIQLETLLKDSELPSAFSLAELEQIQLQLREIDSARIDGKFIGIDGSIPEGQGVVIHVLEACYEDVNELMAAKEDGFEAENLLVTAIYKELHDIKNSLEKLNLTSKWWTTPGGYDKIERVLLSLQSRLGEIDNTRQDGKFISHNGSIPPGQAVLHFLLHKCYRLVHLIQSKSEASSGSLPVSEHLLPIYQNLTTLASCLSQLLKFGVRLTTEECVPYQMKLSAIDRQRKGGIFYGTDGKSIPEGQAEVVSQLEHCYQLLASLKE